MRVIRDMIHLEVMCLLVDGCNWISKPEAGRVESR